MNCIVAHRPAFILAQLLVDRIQQIVYVTPFGWLFIPVIAWILLRRSAWLPALLVCAACLHAPAVLVLGGMGVSPWLMASLAIFIHLCAILWRQHNFALPADTRDKRLFFGWSAFALLGGVSAFTLPFLFAGLSTYDSQDRLSAVAGTTPLEWRSGNAAMAINLAVIWILLLYGPIARPFAKEPKVAYFSMFIAAAAATLASLLQRVLILTHTENQQLIARSLNPSYRQTIGYLFGTEGIRTGWPFSEPSYASAWFAAIAVFGLALALNATSPSRKKAGIATFAAGLIGSINSFSGTGATALAFGIALVWIGEIVAAVIAQGSERKRRLQRSGGMAILALIGLLSAVAISNQFKTMDSNSGRSNLTQVLQEYVLLKIHDANRPDHSRTESNRIALDLVGRTHGLGVGLGSNRASSYSFNLASNVGIVPAALFLWLLISQTIATWRSAFDRDLSRAICAGGVTMFVAINLGIPDLLWPAWWIWPILSFWLVCSESSGGTPQARPQNLAAGPRAAPKRSSSDG